MPYRTQWLSYPAAILFAIPLFVRFGLYWAIFRYAKWGPLAAVVKASALYAVIYFVIFVVTGIPRTTGIIQPILLLIVIGGSRAAIRYLLAEGQTGLFALGGRRRVMIYGSRIVGSFGHPACHAVGVAGDAQCNIGETAWQLGNCSDTARIDGPSAGQSNCKRPS